MHFNTISGHTLFEKLFWQPKSVILCKQINIVGAYLQAECTMYGDGSGDVIGDILLVQAPGEPLQ